MLRNRVLDVLGVLSVFGLAPLLAGCKDEAGPRPDPLAEEACRFGAEAELEEFCDQSAAWRERCEQHATYDEALALSIADCTATGFPVGLGSCDELRAIDRSLEPSGTIYYYDDEGELVGIRVVTDQTFTCPKDSAREESEPVITAGRADDDCELCHACGVGADDREVCSGELAAPYVDQCEETSAFPVPACGACACAQCFPWSFSRIEDTAVLFHECVTDKCAELCAAEPDDDAGMESLQPNEDGGA